VSPIVRRRYPDSGYLDIGRTELRRFAIAVGAGDPVHHDPTAARRRGHPDILATVTFVATLTRAAEWSMLRDRAVDLDRMRHREQRIRHLRPVHAGDTLYCTGTLTELDPVRGRRLWHSHIEVFAAGGETAGDEPVAATWSTVVVTG
jgi:acyl dehydratase